MRICRFNQDRLGIVQSDEIIDVTVALDAIPASRWPLPLGDTLVANWQLLAPAIEHALANGARSALSAVTLHSPITTPTKVIGIARNRRNLADEKKDPGLGNQIRNDGDEAQFFIKANTSLAGPADGISLRFPDRRTDPEAELAIIISKQGSDISAADAFSHVFGYCIGMDVTLRGAESSCSRKSIDTYGLIGPWIVTADEIVNPDALSYSMAINDKIVQSANTANYQFDVVAIIAQVSRFVTLYPGDVIMAGTPVGIFDRIQAGDVVRVEFEQIGGMTLSVRNDR